MGNGHGGKHGKHKKGENKPGEEALVNITNDVFIGKIIIVHSLKCRVLVMVVLLSLAQNFMQLQSIILNMK